MGSVFVLPAAAGTCCLLCLCAEELSKAAACSSVGVAEQSREMQSCCLSTHKQSGVQSQPLVQL